MEATAKQLRESLYIPDLAAAANRIIQALVTLCTWQKYEDSWNKISCDDWTKKYTLLLVSMYYCTYYYSKSSHSVEMGLRKFSKQHYTNTLYFRASLSMVLANLLYKKPNHTIAKTTLCETTLSEDLLYTHCMSFNHFFKECGRLKCQKFCRLYSWSYLQS